nr:hypothetical protein CFP56_52785 [Quercus suber]
MSTITTTTQTETQIGIQAEPNTHAAPIAVPRGDVKTPILFYSPPADGATPFNYVETPPEGQPQRNYGMNPHELTIHDIRGRESEFTINRQGFGVVQGVHTAPGVFDDDATITSQYYPEVERVLLDNVPGAKRIFLFDHTVRRSTADSKRTPVNRAHIDQTTAAARTRVEHHMGEEAGALLQGRVRLINVWRPLNGPVVASPLAFADSTTVSDEDVVPVEHRYPHRTGETAGVKFSPQTRWHYWSGMQNDERVLLQCYDSQDGAKTPHSAFVDPRTKDEWPGRESIEVRALVFG